MNWKDTTEFYSSNRMVLRERGSVGRCKEKISLALTYYAILSLREKDPGEADIVQYVSNMAVIYSSLKSNLLEALRNSPLDFYVKFDNLFSYFVSVSVSPSLSSSLTYFLLFPLPPSFPPS